MGLRGARGLNRDLAVCRWSCQRDWARGSGWAIARLLHRLGDAGGTQERRADGGDYGPWANCGTASIIAAFYWSRSLVRRGSLGQGARDGGAGDRASRTDRGLDHRRHELSQAGTAFGGGGAPNTAGSLASRRTAK